MLTELSITRGERGTRRPETTAAFLRRREDWLSHGILSGFVATFAMTVVLAVDYGLAGALGIEQGSMIERWLWALTHNAIAGETANTVVLALALNLLMGQLWAVVYGCWVEWRLAGPGWRAGLLFSLAPWLLSVLVVLPLLGGGMLGFGLGAGPLPLVGNLMLHAVYGVVLGALYAVPLNAGLDEQDDEHTALAAERGAAFGIVVGAVGGLVIGEAIGRQLGIDATGTAAVAGLFLGGAIGIVPGSLAGMDRRPSPSR